MFERSKRTALLSGIFAGAVTGAWGLTQAASEPHGGDSVRPLIAQALPSMDGGHLELKAVEVRYEPGGSSAGHSHPCPVLAIVTEGAIRSQVDDGPESVFKAGQAFYEVPNGLHKISANASQTEPAKLLAIFICDHETPVTVPIPPR